MCVQGVPVLHQISQFWQNSTKASGMSSSCMYWIPPSLPLQNLSCPIPTVCRTNVGTFRRVYADFITNSPSSIRFQFLQECRLRDQLLAHIKLGLPVTIGPLMRMRMMTIIIVILNQLLFRWGNKIGSLEKYPFCQHTALKAISVHSPLSF